jgi:adenine-specific DNA-methyltransferase
MSNKQKQYGQYFTTNTTLLQNVFDFVRNDEGPILEPSCGEGHIIQFFKQQGVVRSFVAIEIDPDLQRLEGVDEGTTIINCDFLTYETDIKFNSIVGNPPYFKMKVNSNKQSILKSTNIYVAFIEKAFQLLADQGELVFIIPSDFFKLTSATKLKEVMMKEGHFTDIYHPQKENLFKNASQDVIIFRYQKGCKEVVTYHNGKPSSLKLSNGNIYIQEDTVNEDQFIKLEDVFDVKVGMVSGAEKVFTNEEHSNITLRTSSGMKNEILLIEAPSESSAVYQYLLAFKEHLINRKIRKFNEDNWYQWGCLRNVKFMTEHTGKVCMYAKVLTRSKDVFDIGTVGFFDGSILCLYPKNTLTHNQLENIKKHLNSDDALKHFLYSGRYKVGQKTLSDLMIPRSLLFHD